MKVYLPAYSCVSVQVSIMFSIAVTLQLHLMFNTPMPIFSFQEEKEPEAILKHNII